MKIVFIILLCLISFMLLAQPFAIGFTTANFEDAARGNRAVPTEIHYPATVAGQDVAATGTNLPVVVVGHGFLMGVDAYQNIVNELVPEGYIVGLVNTETTFPDHEAFGKDLEFVITEIQALGMGSSIFQGKIGTNAAVMGHSMGGGASFLASPTANIKCMASMAAAETTPSAIAEAANISVPTLVFSAEDDCVAGLTDHQQPMYNALSSDCKTLIEILGGSHCKFADLNVICSTGELTCMGSLSREDQHIILFDYLVPFFDKNLKEDLAAWSQFNNLLASDNRVSYQQNCSGVGVETVNNQVGLELHPNPATNVLVASWDDDFGPIDIEVHDITGKVLIKKNKLLNSNVLTIDLGGLPVGVYLLKVNSSNKVSTQKFIKQ